MNWPDAANRKKAPLIAFEGLDGSGKSTQVKLLSAWLAARNIKHRVFAVFRNSMLSTQFRLLNASRLIGGREATLMYAAELSGRVEYLVEPLREDGAVIIWDKYTAGARIRDRARGLPEELLDAIYAPFPEPDLTLYVSLDPGTATARKRAIGGPTMWESGLDALIAAPISEIEARLADGDITGSEIERHFAAFQGRIYAGYEDYFRDRRCCRLDGLQCPSKLHEQVVVAIEPHLAVAQVCR